MLKKVNKYINNNVLLNPVSMDESDKLKTPKENLLQGLFNEQNIISLIKELKDKRSILFNLFCTGSDIPERDVWWKQLDKEFYDECANFESYTELFIYVTNYNISATKQMSFISFNKIVLFILYIQFNRDHLELENYIDQNMHIVMPRLKPESKSDVWDLTDVTNRMIMSGENYSWTSEGDYLKRMNYIHSESEIKEAVTSAQSNDPIELMFEIKEFLESHLIVASFQEIVSQYGTALALALAEKKIIRESGRKVGTETFALVFFTILKIMLRQGKLSDVKIVEFPDLSYVGFATEDNDGYETTYIPVTNVRENLLNYCNYHGITIVVIRIKDAKIINFR